MRWGRDGVFPFPPAAMPRAPARGRHERGGGGGGALFQIENNKTLRERNVTPCESVTLTASLTGHTH